MSDYPHSLDTRPLPGQRAMRALTVKQPWAWAIAYGGKTVENRDRPHPWRSAIGETIAIHAGKSWDDDADYDDRVIAAALAAGDLFVEEPPRLDPHCYTFGAVIATARLVDVHPQEPLGRLLCSPWAAEGQWHLVLEDVTPLVHPIPARGALGLWRLSPQQLTAVDAALPARSSR